MENGVSLHEAHHRSEIAAQPYGYRRKKLRYNESKWHDYAMLCAGEPILESAPATKEYIVVNGSFCRARDFECF